MFNEKEEKSPCFGTEQVYYFLMYQSDFAIWVAFASRIKKTINSKGGFKKFLVSPHTQTWKKK